MIGSFRRAIAGLLCPCCGSHDVRFPLSAISMAAVFYVFWPMGQGLSGCAIVCGSCGAQLASKMRGAGFAIWGLLVLAAMAVYMAYPMAVPQPFFSIGGLALGYVILDPMIARIGLSLEVL